MQQAQGETVRSPSAIDKAEDPPSAFLPFWLGDESYGIEIQKVQEIRGYESPTAIANPPASIKGVINLRVVGAVVDSVSDVLMLIPLDIEKLMAGADMALVETAAH